MMKLSSAIKELNTPFSDDFDRFFQIISDHLPEAILVLDTEGRIIYTNSTAETMFGYSADEIIGQSVELLLPDEASHPHRQYIKTFLEENASLKCIGKNQPVYGKHRAGHLVPLVVTISQHQWQEQEYILCSVQDITDHIAQQQALHESEQRYRSMLESQSALIVRVDSKGCFTFANQAYCQMFGKRLEELVGSSFTPLVHPDDLQTTLEAMNRLDFPPYRITVEQRAMTAIGWRWLRWEDSVIRDKAGNLFEIQGVGYDITEQKGAQEIALVERNLAIFLAQKSTLTEALPVCLDLALQVADMDCGGIYLVDRQTQDLVLKEHSGLSDPFVSQVSRYLKGSDRHQLVMKGDPIYQSYLHLGVSKSQIQEREGLRSLVMIPILFNQTVIACINLASHSKDEMPEFHRIAVEKLALQLGNMIARFQVQDELLENQQQLQSMFDSLQDFVFVLDGEGRIIQVNQVVLKQLGYAQEDILGMNVLEIHPPGQRQLAWRIVQDMLNGFVDYCPLDLLKKDGSLIPVETKVARGRWGNQDVLIGVSRDITERKAAEELRVRQTQLLAYRHEFEELLTSISTHFINLPAPNIDQQINQVLAQVGEFERVDRSYVFLLDEPTGTMTNTHEWCAPGIEPQIANLKDIPTDIFPWWMKKLTRLEEVYIPIVAQLPPEAQAERELLEQQSIQSALVVPLVSHNRLIGFLGFDSVTHQRYWSPDSILLVKMVGDILSNAFMRRQIEDNLRRSEARNSALLGAIPDLIFRIRRDGVFIDFKATSEHLLLIPTDQIIGASLLNTMDSSTAQKAMACIEQALQTGQVQTLEYTQMVQDSSHVFEARFKNSGADEVIAIVRDISERARLEQMKSDFINRATHELRTPIATMLLMANLLESDPSKEEYDEYWNIMKSELNHERTLVEGLLTAGRLESGRTNYHFHPLNIEDLIQRVIQPLELTAREKDISLTVYSELTGDQTEHFVNADDTALSQVFVNLVGNAIKFTPAGGKVLVNLQQAESGIEISICDTGIGIPKEDLPMLFTRFFRGANAIEDEIQGSGIGLFIVRSILEKHGGKIQVASELGKGSQFDVWLPEVASS